MSKSEINSPGSPKLSKEIFVNTTEYETRIATKENGHLVELLVERPQKEMLLGDIFKGRVTAVLPGIQAAFVDIGMDKAGFLHFSDLSDHKGESSLLADLEYFDKEGEEVPRARIRRNASIAEVLKKDQEILVQVIKEPIGNKGPRLASEISLAGRYVVLLPGARHIAVSKKISSWSEKKRLRKIAEEFLPDNFGMIIRTVAEGREHPDFAADIKFLTRLWDKMKKKVENSRAPALVHKDIEMIFGIIRDLLTPDVARVVIDDKKEYKRFLSYLKELVPDLVGRIELYNGEKPLFDYYEIEPDIEKMLDRKVWLKKGGYIVIDQTEALVAIDVNTGRYRGKSKISDAIFMTNIEAAREIARQIRLRDIGGIIIVDFIDMEDREHRKKVFEEFKAALKSDRSQTYISSISDLGLIEMTRQRVRPSLMYAFSDACPVCTGFGRVLSKESITMKVERWFLRAAAATGKGHYQLVASPQVIDLLTDSESRRLAKLERRLGITVNVIRDTSMHPEEFHISDSKKDIDITEKYKI
jgi:ribonuclease G